jgi:hypothetical protein
MITFVCVQKIISEVFLYLHQILKYEISKLDYR